MIRAIALMPRKVDDEVRKRYSPAKSCYSRLVSLVPTSLEIGCGAYIMRSRCIYAVFSSNYLVSQ